MPKRPLNRLARKIKAIQSYARSLAATAKEDLQYDEEDVQRMEDALSDVEAIAEHLGRKVREAMELLDEEYGWEETPGSS